MVGTVPIAITHAEAAAKTAGMSIGMGVAAPSHHDGRIALLAGR
jgi:hypothetical protein